MLQNNVLSFENLQVGGKIIHLNLFRNFLARFPAVLRTYLYVRERQISPVTETDADESPPRQLRQAAGTTSVPT